MNAKPMHTIDVLVVEDSPTVREFLVYILHQEPTIRVVSTAGDGEEAVKLVQRMKPKVVTMDINLPRMNGFEATRCIMEIQPTPVILVTGQWDPGDVEITRRAAQAGAQAVLSRPRSLGHDTFETSVKELVQMVKLMSEVKVVRRWPRLRRGLASDTTPPVLERDAEIDIQAVAIGASTGGPAVLRALFSGLPQAFPAPIPLVQHMAPGFVQSFSEWLAQFTPLTVQIARYGDTLLSGHIYIAPDGYHMVVGRSGCVVLDRGEPEQGARPSVSVLLRTIARVFGKHAMGILLTGMGKDGVSELKTLRDLGAVTLVQDKASAVVHGMAGEAIKCDAATFVLPPHGIATMLRKVCCERSEHKTCDERL